MSEIINLPIHKFTITEDDDRFLRLELWLCTIGENLNESYIDKQAYEYARPTIEYIPMCGMLSEDKNRFLGHEELEKPFGCVLDLNNNNYCYKIDESNGLEYVVVDAIVFKQYCEDEVNVILNNDGKCNISMEIEVEDGFLDKKTKVYHIEKFRYNCVTAIGVDPGMEGAHLQVKYAKTIDYIKQELTEYFSRKFNSNTNEKFIKQEDIGKNSSIKIDLSKESADMNGDWGSVNKEKLYNDLLSAKNYKACINACYLYIENDYIDSPSSKLHYPVCKISEGKLILSAKGCESALSFLEKNKSVSYYTSAKAKLKRYYKKLGLSTENFSEDINNNQINNKIKEDELMSFNKEEFASKFGLTTNQLYDELYKVCNNAETYIDEYWGGEFCRYNLRDYDENFVYMRDYKEGKMVKASYAMKGDNPCIDMSTVKRVKSVYADWEDEKSDESDDSIIDGFSKEQAEFAKKSLETTKSELESLKTEFANTKAEFETKSAEFTSKLEEKNNALLTLNTQHTELTEKFSTLETTLVTTISEKDGIIASKDAEIEQFKTDLSKYELEEKKEKINEVIKEFANVLSKEEIDNFMEKSETFEKIEDFKTEVKLFVCDKLTANINSGKQTQTNFSSMAIIDNQNENQNNSESKATSVWDRLKDNK